MNGRTVPAMGQPIFAHHSAMKPKTTLWGANEVHYRGLVGATWLPMGLYALPMSPNDCPTTAQVALRTVKYRRRNCIFQLAHVGHF